MKITSIILNKISSHLRLSKPDKPTPPKFFCEQLKIDSFEKLAQPLSVDENLSRFYVSLQKRMRILNPADVVDMVSRISKVTSVNKEDIYSVMGLLTQFSSNKSLKKIEQELNNRNISSINNLEYIYNSRYEGVPITLSTVMSYVAKRNFDLKLNKSHIQGVFLDSNLLDYLDKASYADKKFFRDELVEAPWQRFLYIENFEKGYNIFNQSKSLEDFTIDFLKEVKQLQTGNTKDGIISYAKYLLNQPVLKRTEEKELMPFIISIDSPKVPTAKDICDNVNPVLPTKEELKNTISLISRYISYTCSSEVEDIEKYVINYLKMMMQPVTPKKYMEAINVLKSKISEFLILNNKKTDNVYFAVPNPSKSFVVPLYQYQNMSKKPLHLILPSTDDFEPEFNLKLLPNDSTIIVVDDCSITGSSIAKDIFPYANVVYKRKDISVLLTPLFSTQMAKDNVNSLISKHHREDRDAFIAANIIPQWPLSMTSKNAKYLDEERCNPYMTAFTLPYMGPDTNCAALGHFFELFFENPKAQKLGIKNLEF